MNLTAPPPLIVEDERPLCLYCAKLMKGRTDKRYCSIQCKNAFNNVRRTAEYPFVTDAQLHRNRSILKHFLDEDATTEVVSRKVLEHAGFRFDLFTGMGKRLDGSMAFRLYEYDWIETADHVIKIYRID